MATGGTPSDHHLTEATVRSNPPERQGSRLLLWGPQMRRVLLSASDSRIRGGAPSSRSPRKCQGSLTI